MMPRGVRAWWQRITTRPCSDCGAPIPVSEYVPTGETKKGSWWAGGSMELECPECGATFWLKK